MKHHIPLLSAIGDQVRKPFPLHQVPGAGYAGCSHGTAGIPFWCIGILPFGTENSIDIPILMFCEPQVIYIGIGIVRLRQGNGPVPEPEIINPVGTLGYGKK
jgi:hypothetical protein